MALLTASGRSARGIVAACAIALACLVLPGGARGAGTQFGTPAATAKWDAGVTFTEPAVLSGSPSRVEVLVQTPDSPGSFVAELPSPRPGPATLSYTLDTASTGTLPNTPFTARWRITYPDGTVDVGPPVTATYADTRYQWRTTAGSLVRVHWYAGGEAAGREALRLAEDGIARASALFGVTETRPMDFFLYADQQDLLGALGPGTREWVGGTLDEQTRTLFADMATATSSSNAVAHELTHLVFGTAVQNPYHMPSRWFDEGVAVYLAAGFRDSDRAILQGAVAANALIPLVALDGQFPTTSEQADLAYAESVSAIDFLVRTYGRAGLVGIVAAYGRGASDDEAFRAGTGTDVAGFQTAWLKDLGSAAPERFGPQSPPPGPLPAGWTDALPSAGTGGALPSGAPPAAPAASPGAADAASNGATDDLLAGLAVAAALVAGVGAFYLIGRRRRGPANPVAASAGAAALPGREPLADEVPDDPFERVPEAPGARDPVIPEGDPAARGPDAP